MWLSIRKIGYLLLLLVLLLGNALAETDQKNFLIIAVQNNDFVAVNRLLANGVNVDTHDDRGRSALLIATYKNYREMAELLINAGADVNLRDDLDDSPYLFAGAEGRLDILRMTVNAGADLSSVNRYGGTALIPAAHHAHVETVAYLLTTNIDIDHVNFLGWTALLEAVILGDGGEKHQKIVGLLLASGADASITDKEGLSPLDHARRNGYYKIIRSLERYDR